MWRGFPGTEWRLKGNNLCNATPSVSHLLFAYESLLLVEADKNGA
jgi:hypothetical protein